jgi:hypothetical protein
VGAGVRRSKGRIRSSGQGAGLNRRVFLLLDPIERVALVVGFERLAEQRVDVRVERVLLALVDLDGGEERERVREEWIAYLDGLEDELVAQDAEERVHSFAGFLNGLVRPPDFVEETDAQNDGESVDARDAPSSPGASVPTSTDEMGRAPLKRPRPGHEEKGPPHA